MNNLQAIQTLFKAVEQAESPYRNFDMALLQIADPEHEIFSALSAETEVTYTDIGNQWKWNASWSTGGVSTLFPKFTASIDEALALVRRSYPGIGVILQSGYRGPYSCCTLRKQDGAAFTTGSMIGQVERPDDEMALAIVGAYLMAKEFDAENSEAAEEDSHAV